MPESNRTITIQIGNSDNKLTKNEWAHFVMAMDQDIKAMVFRVHFASGSNTEDPWQNFCWICEVDSSVLGPLYHVIRRTRAAHNQDSVAVTLGDTEFI